MITIKVSYRCKLCGFTDFYIMPLEKKTKTGDIISSPTNFRVKCKKCGKLYSIEILLKIL